ncbi:MAG: hypothetical protein CSB47_03405 [Proteobacteria bacterium]|nr:MAG: hypothetical protein CSB47_03405 [Pseudomonadota bacterium]
MGVEIGGGFIFIIDKPLFISGACALYLLLITLLWLISCNESAKIGFNHATHCFRKLFSDLVVAPVDTDITL